MGLNWTLSIVQSIGLLEDDVNFKKGIKLFTEISKNFQEADTHMDLEFSCLDFHSFEAAFEMN